MAIVYLVALWGLNMGNIFKWGKGQIMISRSCLMHPDKIFKTLLFLPPISPQEDWDYTLFPPHAAFYVGSRDWTQAISFSHQAIFLGPLQLLNDSFPPVSQIIEISHTLKITHLCPASQIQDPFTAMVTAAIISGATRQPRCPPEQVRRAGEENVV